MSKTSMRACAIESFGEPEVLEMRELPLPDLKPGHLLIKNLATSVNPVDVKIRSGAVKQMCPDFPAVLGCDVAGTIEKVGEGVSGFCEGEEVYACPTGVKPLSGALAEYVVAGADLVAKAPESLSLLDSAAVPLVGITAWEALIDRTKIQPGQRVLVHGGTGGVGHIGVQIAKAAGAIVTTTVSTEEKAAIARDLGADNTVLYPEESVESYVEKYTGGRGFDIVFDTVGGENIGKCIEAVAHLGTIATIVARSEQDLSAMHAKGATLHCVLMLLPLILDRGREHHGEILRRLARMIDNGQIKPLFDEEIFDLENAAGAHAKMESGRHIGKIRIKIG